MSRTEAEGLADRIRITTTSRYLRSTTLRLERALSLLEQHGRPEAGANNDRQDDNDTWKSATFVPHCTANPDKADDRIDAEIVDAIELVSLNPASWNHLGGWFRTLSDLRGAA